MSALCRLVDAAFEAPGVVRVSSPVCAAVPGAAWAAWGALRSVCASASARAGTIGWAAWLDSGMVTAAHPRAPWAVLADPVDVWPPGPGAHGFGGWARFVGGPARGAPGAILPVSVGMFSYEAGTWGGDVPVAPLDPLGLPEASWARYATLVCGDRADPSRGVACASLVPGRARAVAAAWRSAPAPREVRSGGFIRPPRVARGACGYEEAVGRVLEAIHQGEVYQVNVTRRWQARVAPGVDPGAVFARGLEVVPVPFAALVGAGSAWVVSLSPECLLAWTPQGRVASLPIKGTRARGGDARSDTAVRAELSRDPKERAEHVMIVDLLRNDLGRVCAAGSVRVPVLEQAVAYPNVWHLVSRIEGRLNPTVGLEALLEAIMPGGSVTGAPKIRATEIIAAVEGARRGAYCGAVGLVSPRFGGTLNLAIRTAVLWPHTGRVCWHAGGGIVADSQPAQERAEAAHKAAFWMRVFAA